MKASLKDNIVDTVLVIILIIIAFATIYPFIYVLSNSISSLDAVVDQKVKFFPIGFSIDSYVMILKNQELWLAYFNTIWYVVVGTAINMVLTVMSAYPLSRKDFFARNPLMLFITVTMFFSGGMIPFFLLIRDLHLYDTRWALILPSALSAWNIILARIYFQSTIPDSIIESARIDGASEGKILMRLIVPLSAPILAVIAIYTAVGFWNTYFNALLFLPSTKLQPLQILLMRILTRNSGEMMNGGSLAIINQTFVYMQLKYAIIIITILPIVFIYPFFQKYFIKGVMIGSIKG